MGRNLKVLVCLSLRGGAGSASGGCATCYGVSIWSVPLTQLWYVVRGIAFLAMLRYP